MLQGSPDKSDKTLCQHTCITHLSNLYRTDIEHKYTEENILEIHTHCAVFIDIFLFSEGIRSENRGKLAFQELFGNVYYTNTLAVTHLRSCNSCSRSLYIVNLNPLNTKHLYNVGPTSLTLVQHCTHVIEMFCVYWETTMLEYGPF